METKKSNLSVNTAYIGGHLTSDPEYKVSTGGVAIITFTIAVNRKYKSNDEWKEETEFVRIKAFSQIAERAKSYLSKGSTALVIGRIHTSSWEDNGMKKYMTEIIAESIQKIDPNEGKPKEENEEPEEEMEVEKNATDEIDTKDIPF